MKDRPATIECIAEPVSHAVIECAEQAIPYKGPDESGRLKVTRLDSHNRPDPNGNRWRLELQIRAKEVEEWFDSYVCRCEAWNKIIELQRPKKVLSQETIVTEAYLDRKFLVEPTSTDIAVGNRLTLSCVPPKGKPDPELRGYVTGHIRLSAKKSDALHSKAGDSFSSHLQFTGVIKPNSVLRVERYGTPHSPSMS
ncbi:hypothetical protein PHET_00629 [Paragonimus heterotremus]|uniref:Uncharacterized protein n=1 Tax=Paragonimus heterotremus TaxID=100268 RepID=A0A8J4WJS5_9TREM|nr:hypothetical protein PHET_00629 [Paragonimus heterotremus]